MTFRFRKARVSLKLPSHPTHSQSQSVVSRVSFCIFDKEEKSNNSLDFNIIAWKFISFFFLILFSLFWNWELKDTNNQRPAQAEPAMDGGDWKTHLSADSRHRIVNKM
ncbi:hypothetical protein CK203_098092 [Vitis vinifera]|uniref:Uncharacterized protein n=1 Tax=Vitis vinifera TaxID=29760 RepID=A0A438DMZ8_VITVI|nr:hypothetical protein CK203_098092 [Vitis vinifera]